MIKGLLSRLALLPTLAFVCLAATPVPEKPAAFEQSGNWLIDKYQTFCTAVAVTADDTSVILTAHEGAAWFNVTLLNERWKSIVDDSDMAFVATFSLKGREITTQTIEAKGLNADVYGFQFFADNTGSPDEFSVVGLFLTADYMSLERDGVPIVDVSLKGSNAAILSLMKCHAAVQKRPGFDPFILK